ncbi:MFS transporter [Acuticoccus sp. MNP-M23]|uniref:MFS transporter n=1 Tax=Acuticoccus sp. MNP-M23 TaxID=3072793 RepID=UPI002815C68F|nr:MFS transporter [Acuticoccus sp. MNP-M23]WMS42178.1 MFS transporter [Acuticoccus sp. MNP-M23]
MLIALRVFLPFALTYLLAYTLRVINAVAGEPISADLGLSAADLGFLTSVYLAAFALCQLPFGLLMDRYGPRRVEAALLVIAAIGCGGFALASSFAELTIGRVLMGAGASVCLMAPFTAYRKWFSAERLPLAIGLLMMFGGAGSVLGGGPAEALLGVMGWRGVFGLGAVLTLACAVSILFVVPSKREAKESPGFATLTRELGAVLKSRALWWIAPMAATVHAGFLSILGLWTGPWLRDVAGLSADAAAFWLSMSALGLMFGFFAFGVIASRAERAGKSLHVCVIGSLFYAAVTVLIVVLPPSLATPLWVPFAIFGSSGILAYAITTKHFREEHAGRVNTTLNFLVFFFAFLVQWGFGVILGFFPAAGGEGASPLGFQVALCVLLVLQGLSYLPLFLRPAVPPAVD